MNFVLALSLVASGLFNSILERALTQVDKREWAEAARSLAEAETDDPGAFAANNLHYLQGRVAEHLVDLSRAQSEFSQIPPGNPLSPLAVWHRAQGAARLRDDVSAELLLGQLPTNFSQDLRMEIAKVASDTLALKIYQGIPTRQARFERFRLNNDEFNLWVLLREKKDDDVALKAAGLLTGVAVTVRQYMDLADVFLAHRQFDQALKYYESATNDEKLEPQARYQMARTYFLSERYQLAIEVFKNVALAYPGTNWEKDSQYQTASCYWRLADYPNAEKAYLNYIQRYAPSRVDEGAVRNLVDVYRVQGELQKALALVDRTLARTLTIAGRQVFLFTKAKILYSQGKYAAASILFQQLGRSRLRSTAGGTNVDEVRYFHAMSQWHLGNKSTANTIWRSLASNSFSYYGQKSSARLAVDEKVSSAGSPCIPDTRDVRQEVSNSLSGWLRPVRSEADALPLLGNAVVELAFMRLWDEASMWSEQVTSRPDALLAARLAYLGGRYNRSIAHANRLPKSNSTLPLLYPAGFRQLICSSAATYHADPLWLHAVIWQESKYNPQALSGASARGLMQFIPDTASTISTAIGIVNMPLDRLYEPEISIPMGAHYWASLIQEFTFPELALAAYNGGPDNVRRWKNKWPAGDEEFFVSDIGFVETKNYVTAVFAARAAYGLLN